MGTATSWWASHFVRSYAERWRPSNRYDSSTTAPPVSELTASELV